MSILKTSLLAMVATVAAMGATSASAAHFEVLSGGTWTQNGTTHLKGPTTASFLSNSLPCANADFTLQVTGGR